MKKNYNTINESIKKMMSLTTMLEKNDFKRPIDENIYFRDIKPLPEELLSKELFTREDIGSILTLLSSYADSNMIYRFEEIKKMLGLPYNLDEAYDYPQTEWEGSRREQPYTSKGEMEELMGPNDADAEADLKAQSELHEDGVNLTKADFRKNRLDKAAVKFNSELSLCKQTFNRLAQPYTDVRNLNLNEYVISDIDVHLTNMYNTIKAVKKEYPANEIPEKPLFV